MALHGATTANLLHLFDCSLAAATIVSNYLQFEQQFNDLAFEKGNAPSATLASAPSRRRNTPWRPSGNTTTASETNKPEYPRSGSGTFAPEF